MNVALIDKNPSCSPHLGRGYMTLINSSDYSKTQQQNLNELSRTRSCQGYIHYCRYGLVLKSVGNCKAFFIYLAESNSYRSQHVRRVFIVTDARQVLESR